MDLDHIKYKKNPQLTTPDEEASIPDGATPVVLINYQSLIVFIFIIYHSSSFSFIFFFFEYSFFFLTLSIAFTKREGCFNDQSFFENCSFSYLSVRVIVSFFCMQQNAYKKRK